MTGPPGHTNDYEAGMAAFHAGDSGKAIIHLQQLAGGNSIQASLARFYAAQSHLRLGLERYRQRLYAAAVDHFRRAADINPAAHGLCGYLAACHVALGQYDCGAAELSRVLDAHPQDVEARIRLALVTWKRGDARGARQILADGLAHDPDQPEWLYQLGVLLAADDDYAAAIEPLRHCLAHAPDHGRAHLRLAQCLGALGRPVDALEHLVAAQRQMPNDGMIALQISLLAGATHARRRIAPPTLRPPTTLDAQDDGALDRLCALIVDDPEFVDSLLTLPASPVDAEVFTAVLAALRRAAEAHPEYADVHHRCSQVLERLGRLHEAIASAERALSINPRYVHALIQLAQLYQATDRAEQAVDRLEQALSYGANYADVHYMLGRMHERRGHVDAARQAYERALNLNAGYDAARQALAALAA